MGKRGPKPLSAAIRVARGNPSRTPINTREPRPRSGTPDAAPGIMDDAKLIYRRLVSACERMRVLTEADGQMLTLVADTLALRQQYIRVLESEGPMLETEKGTYAHPAAKMVMSLTEQSRKLLGIFGLSPADRAGLQTETPDGVADDLEKLVAM